MLGLHHLLLRDELQLLDRPRLALGGVGERDLHELGRLGAEVGFGELVETVAGAEGEPLLAVDGALDLEVLGEGAGTTGSIEADAGDSLLSRELDLIPHALLLVGLGFPAGLTIGVATILGGLRGVAGRGRRFR